MKKLILLLFLSACGAPVADDPKPVPVQVPSNLTFAKDVQPLLQRYCAQCHNDDTFISEENVFLTSKAPTRIANGSMPQKSGKYAAEWGAGQKAIIAKFVLENK